MTKHELDDKSTTLPPTKVDDKILTLAPESDQEVDLDDDHDWRFPVQRVDGLIVPAKYEIWANGVFERNAKSKPYPDTLKPPMPNRLRMCPPEHMKHLSNITMRPLWVQARGFRPDVEDMPCYLAKIVWANNPGQVKVIGPHENASPDDDVEDKTEYHDKLRDRWVELGQICDTKKLLALASFNLPIASHNVTKVSHFLYRMHERNFRQQTEKNIAFRTGYYRVAVPDDANPIVTRDRHGWLLGSTFIGATGIVVDNSVQNAYQKALKTHGLENDWTEFTRKYVDKHVIARWLMACSFASPLLRFVFRSFVVHHYAPSRKGKTVLSWMAQSVYGDPQGMTWTFNATKQAMNEIFRYVSDVPVLFNELQASDIKNELSEVIYNWCEGKHRERVRSDGGLHRSTGEYKCLIRTTGEESLISRNADVGGLNTRVLEISGLGLSESEGREIYTYFQRGGSYGHAGVKYLTTLSDLFNDKDRDFHTQIRTRWQKFKDRIATGSESDMYVERLASVALGEFLMLQWIYGYDAERAEKVCMSDAIEILSRVESRSEGSDSLGLRSLSMLIEHYRSHPEIYCNLDTDDGIRKALEGSHQWKGIFGYVRGEEIWYNPKALETMLATVFGTDDKPADWYRILDDLAEMNILKMSKTRRMSQRSYHNVGIKQHWFYVIDRTRFILEDESDLIKAPTAQSIDDWYKSLVKSNSNPTES